MTTVVPNKSYKSSNAIARPAKTQTTFKADEKRTWKNPAAVTAKPADKNFPSTNQTSMALKQEEDEVTDNPSSNLPLPRHYQSCPNLAGVRRRLAAVEAEIESKTTTTTSATTSDYDSPNSGAPPPTRQQFKLDHLLNINPKRLYQNCTFRCRIHDVIDESGNFWLEVLYSVDEERKFFEIFKLFRLCSKISDPPQRIFRNQRLSALYKGEWHRAIVVEHDEFQSEVGSFNYL